MTAATRIASALDKTKSGRSTSTDGAHQSPEFARREERSLRARAEHRATGMLDHAHEVRSNRLANRLEVSVIDPALPEGLVSEAP
jgi:hypothetical protein